MKTRRTNGWVAAVAAFVLTAACGSSSEPDQSTQTPGVSTTGGNAGAAAASAGGAAGAGVTSVMCGAMTCSNPAVSILAQIKMFMPAAALATPCCLPSGGCGWEDKAGACTAPPDKAMCPAPSIPGFSALTGCCIESSQTCGIDSSAIGLGCMGNMFGGAATKCDGTSAAPAGGAAGTPAAGGAAGAKAGAAGAAGGAPSGAAGGGAAGTAAGAAGAAAGAAGKAAAGTSGGVAGSSSGTAGKAGSAASAGAGGR